MFRVVARHNYTYKVLQEMCFAKYSNAEYIANKWRLYYGDSAYVIIEKSLEKEIMCG